MACTDGSTKFLHVNDIGDTLLMSQLEMNCKSFLDWGFLAIGGWFDVNRPTSGIYGGMFDDLIPVEDPSYDNGQVWETARKDWVWETGVEYQDGTGSQPIDISGVYVNNTLYTTGHATYSHYYDYSLGRVIFNTAISTTANVELNYSYRWVQVYIADNAPWWQELQYGSFQTNDPQFTSGSGEWSLFASNRVQLPAIVLECVPRRSSYPYELGNHAVVMEQDILFHVLAETRHDRNQLIDVLCSQTDRTIWLYDSENVASDGVQGLDYRGMLNPNASMYNNLVEDYRWKRCRFVKALASEVQSPFPTLHEGTVRIGCEIIVGTY